MRVKYNTARSYNPHSWPAFWRCSVRIQTDYETCSPVPSVCRHISHFPLLISTTHSESPSSNWLPAISCSGNNLVSSQDLERNLRPAGCSSGLTKSSPANLTGLAEASRRRW